MDVKMYLKNVLLYILSDNNYSTWTIHIKLELFFKFLLLGTTFFGMHEISVMI